MTAPGTLYLSAHYGYEGNTAGGWLDTVTTRPELEADGWNYEGNMKNLEGRVFRLFSKDVAVGQYDLRVNKYLPPLLITPTATTGITPSNETPWPVYGNVAVSEFNPVELLESTTPGVGFTNVPTELLGSQIFSEVRRPHDGELEFRVLDDGTAYVAGFFEFEGNADGDWIDDALSEADLVDLGWEHFGTMNDFEDRPYEIYRQDLLAGEDFRLRFNKYSPPLLILSAVPEPGSGALATLAFVAFLGYGVRRRKLRTG